MTGTIDHHNFATWVVDRPGEQWKFWLTARPFFNLDLLVVVVCAGILLLIKWAGWRQQGPLHAYCVKTALRGVFSLMSNSLTLSVSAAALCLNKSRHARLFGGCLWTLAAMDWMFSFIPWWAHMVVDFILILGAAVGFTSWSLAGFVWQLSLHWAGVPVALGALSSLVPTIIPLTMSLSFLALISFLVMPLPRSDPECLDSLEAQVAEVSARHGQTPQEALDYLRAVLATNAPDEPGLYGYLVAAQYWLRETLGPVGVRAFAGLAIVLGYLVPEQVERAVPAVAYQGWFAAIKNSLWPQIEQ